MEIHSHATIPPFTFLDFKFCMDGVKVSFNLFLIPGVSNSNASTDDLVRQIHLVLTQLQGSNSSRTETCQTAEPEENLGMISINPLNPKIKIWILICYPYSFPTEVVGRNW